MTNHMTNQTAAPGRRPTIQLIGRGLISATILGLLFYNYTATAILHEQRANLLFTEAELSFHEGRYMDGLQKAEELILLQPDDPANYRLATGLSILVADTRRQAKQLDWEHYYGQALEYAEKAVAISGGDVVYKRQRGLVMAQALRAGYPLDCAEVQAYWDNLALETGNVFDGEVAENLISSLCVEAELFRRRVK